MRKKSALYKRLIRNRWELGLVKGGLDGVFSDSQLEVDWITNPFRDRWFADPFILDVTEDYVYVFAEEYRFKTMKGRIAKLSVNRKTLRIDDFVILLELPTHLSFPSILRRDGHVYVYPESCYSGRLDLYELDLNQDKLVFVKTICEDSVWDSVIVNVSGQPQLFTAKKNDYSLDIYEWDSEKDRFVYGRSITSIDKSSRMAGQLFEYKGKVYMPSQYSERIYGGEVMIKEVTVCGGDYSFKEVKRLSSTHPTRRARLHTLNEYKGQVIIDVGGYDFPHIAKWMHGISKIRKSL
jgi:hypothetical protein